MFVHLSVCLSASLFVWLFVCKSVCLVVWLPASLVVLFLCLPACLFIYCIGMHDYLWVTVHHT